MRFPCDHRDHRRPPALLRFPAGYAPGGFTLTELVVSLLLLTVGVLAMASTVAVISFQASANTRSEQAAAVGQARLEALRSGGCSIAAPGSATNRGITERWTVSQTAGSATVAVEVAFVQRGRDRSQRYVSGFRC
jgi:Tfp pilus assembly protein PilV